MGDLLASAGDFHSRRAVDSGVARLGGVAVITLQDYLMGRDKKYTLTPELQSNAEEMVDKGNQLLAKFGQSRKVRSGWRPPEVNAATPNAAKKSKHMNCEALDFEDDEGDLDEYCLANPDVLQEIGLWQEHPSATKGWCHVQIVPPKSGNRVFYP